jgi:outer membrane immunogenic protein
LPDGCYFDKVFSILNFVMFGAVMKRRAIALLAATVLSVGLSQIASAADLPVKASVYNAPIATQYNWTGFYVGGNLGWGWNDDGGQPYCIAPTGLNGIGCAPNNVPGAQINANGVIGGGQIGYNWQANNWVFGIETDIQGANIKGSVNIAGPFAQVGGGNSGVSSFAADETLSWFGTVRGRVGLAWDRVLLYATGGLAYGGVKVDQNFTGFGSQFPSSTSATKTGWTAGGGIEYAFAGNWSGKIEGLYYDLGSVSTSGGAVPVPNGYMSGKNFDVRGGIVRVGLNFKFN